MEDNYKEVYFGIFCQSCRYSYKKDTDEPCCDCLAHPENLNSHRPVNWKGKE